jgi:NADH-quinone oxidoreductase subunit L
MVRLLMLTFYGKNRSDHHTQEHLHETSVVMWGPLVVLAVLSAGVGYLNVPHILPFPAPLLFEHYLDPVISIPPSVAGYWHHLHAEYPHSLEWAIMAVSVVGMALSSILAIGMYSDGFGKLARLLGSAFKGAHRVLTNKYYVDEFYDAYFVSPLRDIAQFLWKIVDVVIIDGIVNGVGQACMLIGGLSSFKMSGSLHRHGMVMIVGIVCMLSVLFF